MLRSKRNKQSNAQLFDQLSATFFQSFEKKITNISLIRQNRYCQIFKADCQKTPVIVKHYNDPQSQLARIEAETCNYYNCVATLSNDFMPGKTLYFDFEKSLICLSFVPGKRLSDIIKLSIVFPQKKSAALLAMKQLGEYLSLAYSQSHDSQKILDPFYVDYFSHCAKNLSTIPVAGRLLFSHTVETTKQRIAAFKQITPVPSFSHRDFVFQNIHVENDKIGLIDFANSVFNGHLLDDYHGLLRALNAMLLPQTLKLELWNAFVSSLDIPVFSQAEHQFFETFHLYRWALLHHQGRRYYQWPRRLMNTIEPHATH